MQENCLNNSYGQSCYPAGQNPNAVSINIFSPAAYSNAPCKVQNTPAATNPLSFYNPPAPNMNFPANYNNLINYPNLNNSAPNAESNIPKQNKVDNQAASETTKKDDNDKKDKKIIPLTDDYIKSLENYLDSNSPKIRLSGIKEVVERFKEDENRKNNPSLIPLLNKALQDSSPSVRFLALTALQLGYTKGDDKTVELLNKIVANSKENFGEDAVLASEALLKIATPEAVTVKGGK